jgi:2-dehydro-3-deoxyphosphogluconate aldolase/(4S)-4-hydroxy-2-oxoglutarate aldolase
MPRKRLDVLNAIVQTGLVPVYYNGEPEVVKLVIAACVAGGCNLFEFTNRGDFAHQVFLEVARWAARELPQCILGVGSICDAPTAAIYLGNRADFVVGPVLEPEVATLCNSRKVSYSPGCGSATEILQAHKLGVEIVKVFPGEQVGGPGFVSSILGPMPWTSIMPTGGVEPTEKSITAWFKAGVVAVGIGKNLFTEGSGEDKEDLVKAGKFQAITNKVARVLAMIKAAREGK